MGFLLRLVANTLAILLVAWMLDGIVVHNTLAGILAGVVLALVNAVVKPILVILTLPLTVLTLGLFYFVVSAICLAIVAALVPGFEVDGVLSTVAGAFLISLFAWIINGLLGSSTERR
jgi:putative membrane protein